MNLGKRANPGALTVKPYVPGKAVKEVQRELNLQDVVKLASNENPHGPSPAARKAIVEAASMVHHYPDPVCGDLREKLAERLGCQPEQLVVGPGADGVIYFLGMALIGQEDEIIIPEVTFSVYETIARIMRGTLVRSRMNDDLAIDLDDIRRLVSPRTRAVFLCNPNNPTGHALPRERLLEFLASVPPSVWVVLDEVYIDFTDPGLRPDSIRLLAGGMNNLIILRSFSKLYGLAGLRVGYGVGDRELIDLIHRLKPPFSVCATAQAAALAALSDSAFTGETLEDCKREKLAFYRELEALRLPYVRSHTNFVFFNTGRDSLDLHRRLLSRGLIVRPGKAFNLPTWLRVTIGTHEENLLFFKALKEVLLP